MRLSAGNISAVQLFDDLKGDLKEWVFTCFPR